MVATSAIHALITHISVHMVTAPSEDTGVSHYYILFSAYSFLQYTTATIYVEKEQLQQNAATYSHCVASAVRGCHQTCMISHGGQDPER